MSKKITEEWKSITDFPGYEVSNLGRVRSINQSWSGLPRLLKPIQSSRGYLNVVLFKDSRRHQFGIHRLVLITFVGSPTKENDIGHHIDGKKLNNELTNLEWSNQSSNQIESYKAEGHGYKAQKLNTDGVKLIRKLSANGATQKALSIMFNVHHTTISNILLRKTWRCV